MAEQDMTLVSHSECDTRFDKQSYCGEVGLSSCQGASRVGSISSCTICLHLARMPLECI